MKPVYPDQKAPGCGAGAELAVLSRPVLVLVAVLLGLLCGCAAAKPAARTRAFDFQRDTFSYPNELVWVYGFDTNGQWTSHAKDPKPDYTLHCFVLARSAAQFFKAARFDPQQPIPDDKTCRQLVRRVVAANPRKTVPEDRRIVIPGYADLRSFSAARGDLLKQECGAAIESYFQRGHWRMVFPFTHHHQETTARELMESVRRDGLAVVHLVRFPSLAINHGIVLFATRESAERIEFSAYDPNDPTEPTGLTFDRATRDFLFPRNHYFPGGPLQVYQVYHRWNY
jgi:hypothetical protein